MVNTWLFKHMVAVILFCLLYIKRLIIDMVNTWLFKHMVALIHSFCLLFLFTVSCGLRVRLRLWEASRTRLSVYLCRRTPARINKV